MIFPVVLILIGLMGGAKSEINLGMLLARRLQVIGSTLCARPVEEKAAIARGFRTQVNGMFAAGQAHLILSRKDVADPILSYLPMTMMDEFGRDISGRTVVFVGDGNNVARSLALVCAHLDVNFTLAAPPTTQPCAPQAAISSQTRLATVRSASGRSQIEGGTIVEA